MHHQCFCKGGTHPQFGELSALLVHNGRAIAVDGDAEIRHHGGCRRIDALGQHTTRAWIQAADVVANVLHFLVREREFGGNPMPSRMHQIVEVAIHHDARWSIWRKLEQEAFSQVSCADAFGLKLL